MKVQMLAVGAVKPYKGNPRRNEAAVDKVARSIKDFGFKQPIVVDQEHVIIVGHTRLLAAMRLGMKEVPVLVATDLSPEKAKAYRLADNRLHEEASWDEDLLAIELAELQKLGADLAATGFDLDEISALLLKDGEFRAFLRRAFSVMFGIVKDGGACYVCHADTEGLNFRAAFREAGFKLGGCLIWCKDALVLGRSDYQWQHEPILYGWKPTAAHKWYGDRKSTTISEFLLGAPISEVEPGVYRMRLGEQWFEIRGEKIAVKELTTTVARIPRPKKNAEHPTMKPVALIDKFLLNSTKTNDLVFDAFGGSGSTLVSCEKLGRRAYLCELDPKFCDVIATRWEQVTGKKATRGIR